MGVDGYEAAGRALDFLREVARECKRCPLAPTRTTVVFGDGPPTADLMIIGEAPGGDEDACGTPFVGDAGRNLDALLGAAGLDRDQAYLTNTVLCHPPGNRPPSPAEVEACAPYLDLQLAAVRPKVVLALGRTAARRLTGAGASLESLRGLPRQAGTAVVVATYHPSPSALNRHPARRAWVREDLAMVRQLLAADQ